jgi:hypothetical protein
MADTPNPASEPEEQNRRGFLDGVDPVEPVLHYLGSSSNAGCAAATRNVEAAVGDGAGSAVGKAAESVADAAGGSAVEAAASSVVEAAGGVAKAIVGGILDGV